MVATTIFLPLRGERKRFIVIPEAARGAVRDLGLHPRPRRRVYPAPPSLAPTVGCASAGVTGASGSETVRPRPAKNPTNTATTPLPNPVTTLTTPLPNPATTRTRAGQDLTRQNRLPRRGRGKTTRAAPALSDQIRTLFDPPSSRKRRKPQSGTQGRNAAIAPAPIPPDRPGSRLYAALRPG